MKKWSSVIILALAQFVMVLDGTVMNVSISTIVADLHTSVTSLQSAITFYTLTMAALMLIGAKLCTRWGLLRAFVIGSVIYGIGSLITGLAQNIQTLMIGWSVIEGLGAVLVIPAVVALVATNYKGKDRIVAYAIIGGISGAASAAGPLIGGFVTTYLSWRYVFIVETLIMLVVLLFSRSFRGSKADKSQKIDVPSALLSASGLLLFVFGLLQSKTWGWITPIAKLTIGEYEIAPFGISMVAYLLLVGIFLLMLFYRRQAKLERTGKQLVSVSLLQLTQLRSGLGVLTAQTVITAAIFFVIPVYLQMVLGFDALQTGLRVLPLSVALIVFSMIGASMAKNHAPRRIVHTGQALLVFGTITLLASIKPDLADVVFMIGMFAVGAGLGLLASQLSNINMSAVKGEKTGEVGGLQGLFQNLGSSLGTAVIGSALVASLTTGFIANINNADLPQDIKAYVSEKSATGVGIVPVSTVYRIAIDKGAGEKQATTITNSYQDAQISGLRQALFLLSAIAVLSPLLAKGIPDKVAS